MSSSSMPRATFSALCAGISASSAACMRPSPLAMAPSRTNTRRVRDVVGALRRGGSGRSGSGWPVARRSWIRACEGGRRQRRRHASAAGLGTAEDHRGRAAGTASRWGCRPGRCGAHRDADVGRSHSGLFLPGGSSASASRTCKGRGVNGDEGTPRMTCGNTDRTASGCGPHTLSKSSGTCSGRATDSGMRSGTGRLLRYGGWLLRGARSTSARRRFLPLHQRVRADLGLQRRGELR